MTLSLPCTLKGRKGRYQVLSKMTEGGMSTIYVGKSNRGVPVIVKEASGVDLAQSEERLGIEAEILRTLSSPGHPRVVRYLDVGSNLGPFCLVEEQLEGETLAELYKDKPADAPTATRHIVQLLEALSYLHARNVIHGDVRPRTSSSTPAVRSSSSTSVRRRKSSISSRDPARSSTRRAGVPRSKIWERQLRRAICTAWARSSSSSSRPRTPKRR